MTKITSAQWVLPTGFTPTVTGITGGTVGGAYWVTGATCFVEATLTWSSAPTFGSSGIRVSLPVAATTGDDPIGPGILQNGTSYYPLLGYLAGGVANFFLLTGTPSQISGNIATLTAAATGRLRVQFSYRCA